MKKRGKRIIKILKWVNERDRNTTLNKKVSVKRISLRTTELNARNIKDKKHRDMHHLININFVSKNLYNIHPILDYILF